MSSCYAQVRHIITTICNYYDQITIMEFEEEKKWIFKIPHNYSIKLSLDQEMKLVHICIDIAALTPQQRDKLGYPLLQYNYQSQSLYGARFGLDPSTSILSLIISLAISECDAPTLHTCLTRLTQTASEWRGRINMRTQEQEAASSSPPPITSASPQPAQAPTQELERRAACFKMLRTLG